MAVAMFMHWAGVTAEEYDRVRQLVDREGTPAPGGFLHIAALDDSGLHVSDLWETAEAFQAFVQNRLMPGVKQLGLQGEPKVTLLPAHAIFAPAYKPV